MPYKQPLTRRSFLRVAVGALAAGAAYSLLPWTVRACADTILIGQSQGGKPLTIYRYGYGQTRLFLLGGQHGGPESNTVELTLRLMEYFSAYPDAIPENVTVYVMPEGNPDGLLTGSRQYLSGVDPNRNWGNSDWQPDAYDSNGSYIYGLGGSAPFSEQETEALASWMLANRPDFTINYHSVGGFMFGGGELSQLYSEVSGYPGSGGRRDGAPRNTSRSRLGYRATGHMNGWARSVGLSACLVELASVHDPEYERNLAAVQAILTRLGVVEL